MNTVEAVMERSEIIVSPEVLAVAQNYYDEGKYSRAAEALREQGEPRYWVNAEARVFGSRLAQQLGASRLSSYLVQKAYRSSRHSSAEARLHYAYHCLGHRGAWVAWESLRGVEGLPQVETAVLASVAALRGRICAFFRDRVGFRRYLDEAHALKADSAWVWTEESSALESLDDPEGALAAVQRALEVKPWYRPAVQQASHLLSSANEDAAAIELLRGAVGQIESGAIFQQWIVLLSEREEPQDIPELCDRAETLFLWADPFLKHWFKARKIDAFYQMGQIAAAAELAEGTLGYESIVPRLKEAGSRHRRVKLNVPFVRQDDATCAPASLASVAAFWNWDVRHDQIAEVVCYGGTYPHRLREWVEENGWIVREFKVTWISCRALIDRGVPFLLATMDVGGGHMQVIEGYDEVWETILIRDPNFRHHRRVEAKPFLARYEAFGPRGFVIVPKSELARLDEVELAASAGFDRLYELSRALQKNDRDSAQAELVGLEADQAGKFLQLAARLALADYDANVLERLRCLDDIEREGLHHPLFASMRLDLLQDFLPAREYLDKIREASRWQVGEENRDWDASLLLKLAEQLAADNANAPEIKRLFLRYHAMQPKDPVALSFWARQLWMSQQRAAALELMRFAATCGDKVEQYSLSYFHASRLNAAEDEALLLLRDRVSLYQDKSPFPSETLYTVLRTLHRDSEAFEVLAEAMRRRPQDGSLLLFCAYEWAYSGSLPEGRRLLEEARPHSREALWMRTAASLAALDGGREEERAYWKKLTELEPLALDAHFQNVRLIEMAEGPLAAVTYWEERCREFPWHVGFSESRARAAYALGENFAEPYVRLWRDLDPQALPPRLEFVSLLLRQGKFDEAAVAVKEAQSLRPFAAEVWYWQGRVNEEMRDYLAAENAWKKAVQLSVDNDHSIRGLWGLAIDREKRSRFLDFVEAELRNQVFAGDGLFAWYDLAAGLVPNDQLRQKLEHLRDKQSYSWPVWLCLLRNDLRAGEVARARQLAVEATGRFALLSEAWMELASIQERGGEFDEADATWRKALELDPFLSSAWTQRAWLLERRGRRAESVQILETALLRSPRDGMLLGVFAGLLWRSGRKDEAFEAMQSALRIMPGSTWASNQFFDWCTQEGRLALLLEFTESLAQERAGDAQTMLMHARALKQAGMYDQAAATVAKVLEAQPRHIEAHLLKTEMLGERQMYVEALAACEAPVWEGRVPVVLMGQAAWMDYARRKPKAAVERLREAVARDPSYVWAWERLVEWSNARRPEEALPAAQRAAELQPNSGYAWQKWSEIHDRLGHAEEAMRLLHEAVSRDPAYAPAVLILVERLIADNKEDQATQILDASIGAISPAFAQVARVLLCLKRKQNDEAALEIEKLFKMEEATSQLISHLMTETTRYRGRVFFAKVLDRAILRSGVQPAAVVFWVQLKFADRDYRLCETLMAVPVENEARRRGLIHYLDHVVVQGGSDCADLLLKHGDELKSDDWIWAQLAFVLDRFYPREIAKWVSDWRSRSKATPWMLRTVVLANLTAGNLEEALAASRAARQKDTVDRSLCFHGLIHCLELALEGRFEEAEQKFSEVEKIRPEQWDRSFLRIVRSLLNVLQAPAKQARRVWKQELSELHDISGDPFFRQVLELISGAGNRKGVSLAPQRNPVKPGSRRSSSSWRRWAIVSFYSSLGLCGLALMVGTGGPPGGEGAFLPLALFMGLGAVGLGGLGMFNVLRLASEKEGWSLGAFLLLLANSSVPIAALLLLVAWFVGMSDEPAKARGNEAKAEASKTGDLASYAHPRNVFQLDLGDQLNSARSNIHQPADAGEGVAIRKSDGNTISAFTTPMLSAESRLDGEREVIDQELAAAQSERNAMLVERYTDAGGRTWVRTASRKEGDTNELMYLSLRDITPVGKEMMVLELEALSANESEDLSTAKEVLNGWHARLKLNAPEIAKPTPRPSAVAASPASSEALTQGLTLKASGQIQEALPLLEAAVQASPYNGETQTQLADAYLQLGRFGESVEAALAATKLASDLPEGWTVLGGAYVQSNKLPEAEEALLKAVSREGASAIPWYYLGRTYELEKKWPEAARALTTAIAKDPANEKCWTLLGRCFVEGNDQIMGEQKLQELLKQYPESAEGWYALGGYQADAGSPRASVASFQKALQLKPNYADVWNALGLSMVALDDSAQARQCFTKAFEIDPRHSEALGNLGFLNLSMGEVETSIGLFQKAIAANPRDTRAMVNLTNAYLKEGKPDLARETCDRLAAISPALADKLRADIHAGKGAP